MSDENDISNVLMKASKVMNGGVSSERVLLWFNNQLLSGFGKTALELVKEGRTEVVLKHLAMLEDGIYA